MVHKLKPSPTVPQCPLPAKPGQALAASAVPNIAVKRSAENRRWLLPALPHRARLPQR